MEFVLSDGSNINDRGYRVLVSGINMDRFAKNPVMLKEHDSRIVIGRWENWKKENNQLKAEPVFDTDDPEGKEIARKVDKNFLRCASIGIIPMKIEEIDGDYVMTESVLVEASIVSIPSDAGAVRLYNDKLEELSFDQVKINFNFSNNNQNANQMADVTGLKLSQKTIERLNLDSDYTAKDVELAVAEKDKEIETLNAKLTAVEKQTQTDYLNNAVKAGKISEAEKLSFSKMAEKGCFDDVKTIIEQKPETASETLADKVTKTNLSAGRENWDYLKWMKEDPKGLGQIRRENPKEFERLQSTIKQ
jgi:HK97 family phage prohead protease